MDNKFKNTRPDACAASPFSSKTGAVAVAMSGGADSTAALILLKEAGLEVFGLTAVMTREISRCCAPEDVEYAALACKKIGVRHFVIHVQDEFESEIINYFVSEYISGRTPSPCVLCNSIIKFGALLRESKKLGAMALATGHYAKIIRNPDEKPRLFRGTDRDKDQSYFLARLSDSQLEQIVFPLGDIRKADVLAKLDNLGFVRPSRGESQDVCFVPDGNHGRWLDLRVIKTPPPGNIVTTDGRVVGKHEGIHHYTVGQRKGLGIAIGYPAYVVKIDAEHNQIVVGSPEEALVRKIEVSGLSWISGTAPETSFNAEVQIRYRHKPSEARIEIDQNDSKKAVIEFSEPQFGAAPGQSAAIYRGDEVLGAGWIKAGFKA